MLLGTLEASLLGDLLTKNLSGKGVIRAGEGTIRAGYRSKRSLLKKIDSTPSITIFEIQMYYQNEPRFNGVYSRDNLPELSSIEKIKDGAYVINLDEYSDIGTHWIPLYVNDNAATYFDSFGIEHILLKIKNFINNKNIIANIYRIQNYDSVMCEYVFIGFSNFMLEGKSLTDFTNLFSPNNF